LRYEHQLDHGEFRWLASGVPIQERLVERQLLHPPFRRGELDDPTLAALLALRVELRRGALTTSSGQRYHDIELTADATSHWLSIHPLIAHAENGRLELRGHASRRARKVNYRLTVRASNGFPLPASEPLSAGFQAILEGSLSFARLTCDLIVHDLRVIKSG
jgi:hypothetical protein